MFTYYKEPCVKTKSYFTASESNPPSITPDDDVFKHLATVYADTHLTMHKGEVCEIGEKFEGGITNGAAWYPLTGAVIKEHTR